ncbi:MAG TPA: hypothetical protein VMV13_06360 [Candidatus Binataceae bacterium]|nr:hypothetical protein [Candidatus Binataceae bacterium]
MKEKETGDVVIDRLIENHPGFAKLLERRLRGPNVSADAASRRLAAKTSPKTRSPIGASRSRRKPIPTAK